MTPSQRISHLYDLAEQDEIYTIWKNTYEEYTSLLEKLSQNQPHYAQIRGYAEAGRMMAQRVALLACEVMCFPWEDPHYEEIT